MAIHCRITLSRIYWNSFLTLLFIPQSLVKPRMIRYYLLELERLQKSNVGKNNTNIIITNITIPILYIILKLEMN